MRLCPTLISNDFKVHSTIPENTMRWPNVGLILDQRRRRWANISPTLGQRPVFAGNRKHCTLQAFEQFGTRYIHNHDDQYPTRQEFEPDTSRLQAPVDTNMPSGPVLHVREGDIHKCCHLIHWTGFLFPHIALK